METSSLTNGGMSIEGKRVVICEDEAMTVMLLARAFENAGLKVVGSASDGIAALKMIKHERPDIVTMDVHLPVMSGVETIRRFMKDSPACVVVISAYSDEEVRQEAMDAGACAFISKPVNGRDIVQEIAQAYHSYSNGAPTDSTAAA